MAAVGASHSPPPSSPHSSWFTSIVGKDLLDRVPIVTTDALKIHMEKYPVVYPENMPFPAAQGWLITRDCSRPFLAVRVEMHDAHRERIMNYVEFIFQRYGDSPANYVASSNNPTVEVFGVGDLSFKYTSSSLYSAGGMTEAQVVKVGALLRGEPITGLEPHQTLRMVSPKSLVLPPAPLSSSTPISPTPAASPIPSKMSLSSPPSIPSLVPNHPDPSIEAPFAVLEPLAIPKALAPARATIPNETFVPVREFNTLRLWQDREVWKAPRLKTKVSF